MAEDSSRSPSFNDCAVRATSTTPSPPHDMTHAAQPRHLRRRKRSAQPQRDSDTSHRAMLQPPALLSPRPTASQPTLSRFMHNEGRTVESQTCRFLAAAATWTWQSLYACSAWIDDTGAASRHFRLSTRTAQSLNDHKTSSARCIRLVLCQRLAGDTSHSNTSPCGVTGAVIACAAPHLARPPARPSSISECML